MTNKSHNDATQEIEQVATPGSVELGGNLSPRRLNPEGGIKAIRTGQAQHCGFIYGEAYAYKEGVSQFGEYVRLIGSFAGLPPDRSQTIMATEIFLPAVPTRAVCAAIDKGNAVPIRFEFLACPDTSGRPGSEAKYVYKTFATQPPDALPPGQRMLIEAGLIDAPKDYERERDGGMVRLPAAMPDTDATAWPEGVDPQTGEVVAAEETKLKDGLDAILRPAAAAE